MDKWREFDRLMGITEDERPMYHAQFDKWLTENVEKGAPAHA